MPFLVRPRFAFNLTELQTAGGGDPDDTDTDEPDGDLPADDGEGGNPFATDHIVDDGGDPDTEEGGSSNSQELDSDSIVADAATDTTAATDVPPDVIAAPLGVAEPTPPAEAQPAVERPPITDAPGHFELVELWCDMRRAGEDAVDIQTELEARAGQVLEEIAVNEADEAEHTTWEDVIAGLGPHLPAAFVRHIADPLDPLEANTQPDRPLASMGMIGIFRYSVGPNDVAHFRVFDPTQGEHETYESEQGHDDTAGALSNYLNAAKPPAENRISHPVAETTTYNWQVRPFRVRYG